jgi:hypothetical protein
LAVAFDVQGPDKPRPYLEMAGATYPAAVDQDGLLAQALHARSVPGAILVDADGGIQFQKIGGFDIRNAEHRRILDEFATDAGGALVGPIDHVPGFDSPELTALFSEGLAHYRAGREEQAVAAWRKASELEPENWIIRKQIWAVENPSRFYGEAIDHSWQDEQIAKGR